MVTNQILQNTIDGIAGISSVDAAVCDSSGKMIASRGDLRSLSEQTVRTFLQNPHKEMKTEEYLLGKIYSDGAVEYVTAVKNNNPNALISFRFLGLQMDGLVTAYKEKIDKDSFVKNLLLDNLLQIDIYNRARKLRIEMGLRRAVLILETENEENLVAELLRQQLSGKPGDFVTTVNESNVVLIHELKSEERPQDELKDLAEELHKTLADAGFRNRIAFGTVVKDLRETSKSYKEAKMALDVSRIFDEEKNVIAYSNLGIGRLIYQLPLNLCRMFISEIFTTRTPDEFDEETLTTIYKFFENNLNVSETSRQLFIHRNTLVYRLDKLQKTTGLDLRAFDDAITFKIALMVVKYMDYMEKIDY